MSVILWCISTIIVAVAIFFVSAAIGFTLALKAAVVKNGFVHDGIAYSVHRVETASGRPPETDAFREAIGSGALDGEIWLAMRRNKERMQ